jgi:hypothetical protein
VARIVTFVSRRAAGVWTTLPSLTFQLLREESSEGGGRVLWIDFGRRFEMLNHLAIEPARFPPASTLAALLTKSPEFEIRHLLTYSAAVKVGADNNDGLARLGGDAAAEYRQVVASWTKDRGDIYMVARDVLQAEAQTIPVSELAAALARLHERLAPSWTFLTFEGQPEEPLFTNALQSDELLRWSLDNSSIVLSFVRFDNRQRFLDSVGVPDAISRSPSWRERLRVVLTRCQTAPIVPDHLRPYFAGRVPFAQFVGTSVNYGRIPLVDIAIRRGSAGADAGDEPAWEEAISSVARALKALFL